jgi:LPXTG-site transpeptidase (sortase) family protein
MAKNVNKRNVSIIIGVLIISAGIAIICSTYYKTKKNEVFDEMNELYYEQVVALEENIDEIDTPEVTSEVTPKEEETTKAKTEVIIDDNNYYVGYLRIPKVNLKRGFTAVDSKYNNVNRNIYVVPSSTFPDQANNNLILAAHSGTSSISYFKNLYQLSLNDDLYLDYNGKEYHYQIKNIYTEIKDGDVAIKRNKKKSTLTLITCTKGDKDTQTIYICELV